MVVFDEVRGVLINNFPHGTTGALIERPAGSYEITLDGPKDFTPPSCVVRLQDTAPLEPCRVEFKRLAAAPTIAPPAPWPRPTKP